jgi:hypothetical protein
MARLHNVTLAGFSGKTYTFQCYTPDTLFNGVGAVYAFLRLPQFGLLTHVLYIGQATNLKVRQSGHETWDKARSLGANCIAAMSVPLLEDRDMIEAELIEAYCPPCNVKGNPLESAFNQLLGAARPQDAFGAANVDGHIHYSQFQFGGLFGLGALKN